MQEKKLMLIAVYDQIPSQLLKQKRRFNYSDIKRSEEKHLSQLSAIRKSEADSSFPFIPI